jgi:hypothetical protein
MRGVQFVGKDLSKLKVYQATCRRMIRYYSGLLAMRGGMGLCGSLEYWQDQLEDAGEAVKRLSGVRCD